MKQNYLLLFALLLFAGCIKMTPTDTSDDSKDTKVTTMIVPVSFDWKTTKETDCNLNAPHASRVLIYNQPAWSPFASCIVGGGVDQISLTLPKTMHTVYIGYQMDGHISTPQQVDIVDNKISFSVPASAKDYTGLVDGDKNDTDANVIYMPARAQGWGTLLFEDMWPAYGDYDFNDLVVSYKVQLYMNNKNKVREMLIAVRVNAIGGSLPYHLYLSLLGVKGGEIDNIEPYVDGFNNAPEGADLVAINAKNNVKDPAILSFRNIRSSANRPSGATYLNTERGYEMSDDQLTEVAFLVTFRNSIALKDVAFDTFDFYMANQEGREIHMGGYAPSPAGMALYNQLKQDNSNIGESEKYYYSNSNLVWALNIPADIRHAYEGEDFLMAYPEFKTWAQSGGDAAQDWYLHGVSENLVRKRN